MHTSPTSSADMNMPDDLWLCNELFVSEEDNRLLIAMTTNAFLISFSLMCAVRASGSDIYIK